MNIRLSFILSSILLITQLFGHHSYAEQSTVNVKVAPLKPHLEGIVSTLSCSVLSANPIRVVSESDAILEMVVPEGRIVAAGQLVAIQKDFYQLKALAKVTEQMAQTDNEIDFTLKALARRQKLYTTQAASEAAVDELTFKLNDLKSQKRQLLIDQAVAKHQLARLEHRAKEAGQVTKVVAATGEKVMEGQAILTLLPLKFKSLACDAPLTMVNSKLAKAGTVFRYGTTELQQVNISHQLDSRSNLARVYFDIEDNDQSLYFNQRVKVEVTYQQDNLFNLSIDALQIDENGEHFVIVVDNAGIASKKKINLITAYDTWVIIQSTLMQYQHVVVKGGSNVLDGSRVTVIEDHH